jgi:hypothetical protein
VIDLIPRLLLGWLNSDDIGFKPYNLYVGAQLIPHPTTGAMRSVLVRAVTMAVKYELGGETIYIYIYIYGFPHAKPNCLSIVPVSLV